MSLQKKHPLILTQDGQSGYTSEIVTSAFDNKFNEMLFGFTLVASNRFYKLEEKFEVKLMETLIPREVKSLKIMSDLTTHNSALATFALPKELEKVSSEMLFDVQMKLAEDGVEKWMKIEHPRLHFKDGDGFLAIGNLNYANTAYGVKIRMKSKAADDVDEMWSPFQTVSFVTRPKTPDMVPKTCANCFNIMDNGNVVIYWMEVPKLYQNANGFKYLVQGWDEEENEIIHKTLVETSMSLQSNLSAENIRIELYSVNSEGISESFSLIDVPIKQHQTTKKLLKIRKELINQEYKISWKLREELDINSFTVFWCHQRHELPNQCDGLIHFRDLPPTERQFSLPATMSNQFGVAYNFKNESVVQGFEWAECTASKANGELMIRGKILRNSITFPFN